MLAIGAVGLLLALLQWIGNRIANETKSEVAAVRQDIGDVKHEVERHSVKLERFDVALFGPQGDNGINGHVKGLIAREEQHEREAKDRQHKDTNRRNAILTRLLRLEEHAGLPTMHPSE